MFISIFRRILIFFIAKKDSKGAYGLYLKDWQAGTDRNETLELSRFMALLIIEYIKKQNRKMSRTRRFKKLYAEILSACNHLDEQLTQRDLQEEVINREIAEIESKLQVLQSRESDLRAAWNTANQTGTLPLGLGVSTARDLKMRIDQMEKDIQSLHEEKKQHKETLNTATRNFNAKFQEACMSLGDAVLSYRDRIDKLYRDLEVLAGKQDKLLVYYWHTLCDQLAKKSKIVICKQAKTFAEICRLRNTQLVEKSKLLCQSSPMSPSSPFLMSRSLIFLN